MSHTLEQIKEAILSKDKIVKDHLGAVVHGLLPGDKMYYTDRSEMVVSLKDWTIEERIYQDKASGKGPSPFGSAPALSGCGGLAAAIYITRKK